MLLRSDLLITCQRCASAVESDESDESDTGHNRPLAFGVADSTRIADDVRAWVSRGPRDRTGRTCVGARTEFLATYSLMDVT